MKKISLFLASVLFGGIASTAYANDPADPNLQRYLFDVARTGDLSLMRDLLIRDVQVDARDDRGNTALILAAYHGKADLVDALLTAGADPNLVDARGNTALMGALFKGEAEVVRRLLRDPRTDVNLRNGAGQTAAMFAALFGRSDALEALVARGADLALADASGQTARSLALRQGNSALAARMAQLTGR